MSPGSVDVPDVLCVHKEVLDGLDPEVELLVLLDPRRVVAGGSAHVPEAEQRQVCFWRNRRRVASHISKEWLEGKYGCRRENTHTCPPDSYMIFGDW
jgi:hypothetical protein